jgi:L-iditol 2-dehydrogenase
MGAADVLLSELSAYRLETAATCGITVVNPSREDLPGKIIDTFGPDKADVIFECVGIDATLQQAVDYARKGSDIVVVGVFANPGTINMGFVQDHELRVIGTAMYRVEDYLKAIELAAGGLVTLDALITHTVGFRDYLQAYRIIEEQKDKAMKVMVSF